MSCLSVLDLDTLSRCGFETQAARDAWHRALNVGADEFTAFEIARAVELDRIAAQHSAIQSVPNPFKRAAAPPRELVLEATPC